MSQQNQQNQQKAEQLERLIEAHQAARILAKELTDEAAVREAQRRNQIMLQAQAILELRRRGLR